MQCPKVAPLVGAWIEILMISVFVIAFSVAPLVGAWIEITSAFSFNVWQAVAPLVGAWIEMIYISTLCLPR